MTLLNLLILPFYLFLDVSGILLGIFLVILGIAMRQKRRIHWSVPWILLIVGASAFLIHFGHYFDLAYMRWLFGEEYFLTH